MDAKLCQAIFSCSPFFRVTYMRCFIELEFHFIRERVKLGIVGISSSEATESCPGFAASSSDQLRCHVSRLKFYRCCLSIGLRHNWLLLPNLIIDPLLYSVGSHGACEQKMRILLSLKLLGSNVLSAKEHSKPTRWLNNHRCSIISVISPTPIFWKREAKQSGKWGRSSGMY